MFTSCIHQNQGKAQETSRLDGRIDYMKNSDINLIEFDYENMEDKYPYIIKKMNPSIFKIISDKKIDLLITAGSGYSEFPFNIIKNIPIILINIFASPNIQNNIVKNICISNDVLNKVSKIIKKEKLDCIYIQSDKPRNSYADSGINLRKTLGINEKDFVFGRIGRPDDNIFDPIALNAFKELDPSLNAHYIIMSPPPVAIEMVKKYNIKNVHFINPSPEEADVWAFHYSLDAMAHFRKDGESFGLNIAESMIAGNPIITHKSDIWNSHLEYLDPDFSIVVEKDDIDGYKKAMECMITSKVNGSIITMKSKAKNKASDIFIIDNNIKDIENIIDSALN
jgi:glycosyltransferase involved in cell wall biosynthesis